MGETTTPPRQQQPNSTTRNKHNLVRAADEVVHVESLQQLLQALAPHVGVRQQPVVDVRRAVARALLARGRQRLAGMATTQQAAMS